MVIAEIYTWQKRAAGSLREHLVFSALSDDRKYVCGSQARRKGVVEDMLTGSLFFFSRHCPFPSLRASYFGLACHYLRAWHQLFGCRFFKTCVKLASSLSPYRGCVTAILLIGLLILPIARLYWWRNLTLAGIYLVNNKITAAFMLRWLHTNPSKIGLDRNVNDPGLF